MGTIRREESIAAIQIRARWLGTSGVTLEVSHREAGSPRVARPRPRRSTLLAFVTAHAASLARAANAHLRELHARVRARAARARARCSPSECAANPRTHQCATRSPGPNTPQMHIWRPPSLDPQISPACTILIMKGMRLRKQVKTLKSPSAPTPMQMTPISTEPIASSARPPAIHRVGPKMREVHTTQAGARWAKHAKANAAMMEAAPPAEPAAAISLTRGAPSPPLSAFVVR